MMTYFIGWKHDMSRNTHTKEQQIQIMLPLTSLFISKSGFYMPEKSSTEHQVLKLSQAAVCHKGGFYILNIARGSSIVFLSSS